jgi:hypothetical protein
LEGSILMSYDLWKTTPPWDSWPYDEDGPDEDEWYDLDSLEDPTPRDEYDLDEEWDFDLWLKAVET